MIDGNGNLNFDAKPIRSTNGSRVTSTTNGADDFASTNLASAPTTACFPAAKDTGQSPNAPAQVRDRISFLVEEPNGRDARGMVSGERPERELQSSPIETPARSVLLPGDWRSEEANRRQRVLQTYWALVEQGVSQTAACKKIGEPYTNVWRYEARFNAAVEAGLPSWEGLLPRTHESGRKPKFLPTADEIACVREIYVRLNESRVRGRGLGSSKVTSFRLAAKSEDPRITELFRAAVLGRKNKTIPPSFARLLDVPSSVLHKARDWNSTMTSHISTPRGMHFINAAGAEVPLRAGSIFESDDGTVNFPVWIPWPFGGDKCSDKFGVKLGRFQLLPVVDRRTRFCPMWNFVVRAKSSYRGEDVVALFGSCFADVGLPEALCLERGSWESNLVKSAMEMAGVTVIRAWEPKQKNAVENFFDRLWTPLSLLPGDVGRRRGENVDNTDDIMRCADGRLDPREKFLSVEAACRCIGNAVSFINSEPVSSNTFGTWIPQAMFHDQTDGGNRLTKLNPAHALFFSREQRTWTVRAGCVGGKVPTPMLDFPVYFQTPEMWEFEGCELKCFFDPFTDPCLGTLVLQNDWRSFRRGHVVARNVPSLEMPPQAVLADDWQRGEELERTLEVRKAMAKAVRTETWNWLGGRRSEARDGQGNVARMENGTVLPASRPTIAAPVQRDGGVAATRRTEDSYAALFGG